ncbi:Pentalenolactone F synthase [Pigmentiphaga humi]|uniref:Pentalenolactone F synthase n=1 Tax=Pigmentiphaga humi TaxID=2478468 RepID=A0A3P4B6R9_9BURK|nr:TauD/TfdA family dioxygenase [Pigmentiphaga humi]VCU71358.1 Pentalenolactone F synthase [Pigmentiphaga humi]
MTRLRSTPTVEKSGSPIGARLKGIDVSGDLDDTEVLLIEQLLYHNSVLAIDAQHLDVAGMRRFCMRLGPLHRNVTTRAATLEFPEIMILTNRRAPDGTPLGNIDAGQDWHTDMSYNAVPGKFTALHGVEVPMRDGKALGATRFADMYSAYEALPDDVQARIEGAVALHDFHKYYDEARRRGSSRPELTPEQRAKRPPVPHPLVGRHPVTGRRFLYADPGYTVEILDMDPEESRQLLDYLFAFQLQDRFVYDHQWRVGDVLIWDNWSTVHRATADYGPDEYRYMLRSQINGWPGLETFDPAAAATAAA